MDNHAREALEIVQRCMETERYTLADHVFHRMDDRVLFESDLLALIDQPDVVRFAGMDTANREKWTLEGTAADGLPLGVVCVLDVNEDGDWVVFITMFTPRR